MRLIDADALMEDVRKEVKLLYDETKDECAEHLDLDDDKVIFLNGLDRYLKVKFAYHWLRCKVDKQPIHLDENEKSKHEVVDKCKWTIKKNFDHVLIRGCNGQPPYQRSDEIEWNYCPYCGEKIEMIFEQEIDMLKEHKYVVKKYRKVYNSCRRSFNIKRSKNYDLFELLKELYNMLGWLERNGEFDEEMYQKIVEYYKENTKEWRKQ